MLKSGQIWRIWRQDQSSSCPKISNFYTYGGPTKTPLNSDGIRRVTAVKKRHRQRRGGGTTGWETSKLVFAVDSFRSGRYGGSH
ncbi:hypothetical protein OSTOST_11789 [Ostertagia ostertagi]